MRYLVDGYNLIHAVGLTRKKVGPTGLAKARLQLLGLIAGSLGTKATEVTVVFDGTGGPRDSPRIETHRGVEVRFARASERADDVIIDLIHHHSAPKQLTVVSEDREITQAARQRGCVVMKCDPFVEWLRNQYAKRPSGPEEPKGKTAGLSEGQTEQWLKEFGELDDDPTLGEPPLFS